MALSWWDIPGPYRFVSRIENDLRDRINVVAALPAGIGKEWFDFFRRRWADNQERIDILQSSVETNSPLEALSCAFTTQRPGTITIRDLTQEAGFRGRTVGIMLNVKDPLSEWIEFLVSYEQECRMIDMLDRTVFLLAMDGVSPKNLPSPETHLRVHTYEGYAQTQDCYMYSWGLLGVEKRQAWRTELKMALCAHLAQWDPRLCEILSDLDIGSILNPESSIAALPIGRYVSPAVDLDRGWAMGILQRCDDQVVYHSGWIGRDTISKEFQHRVWAAQVQVIFPLIEQVRRQAIEKYGSRFRLPVLVSEGEYVNDPFDLEIAMVRRIVSRMGGVPQSVIRRLDQAWEFRNALAHIQPLTEIQLQAFEPSLDY